MHAMKFVTHLSGTTFRNAKVAKDEAVRRRPNQQVVAVSDLSPEEREELARLLEAELARL